MQKKIYNSGITLIALIITIIVMLILVAVAVNTAVQSGLFGHAKNATESWAKREAEEGNIGNDNFIKDTVGQYTNNPDRSFLNVGDYVDYTPDVAPNYTKIGLLESGSSENLVDGFPQDTTLTWRILSINDDGSVDIVSSTPTTTELYIHGPIGFNNGVYLLNDLCANLYSNTELSVTARSMNLIDIESKMNATGIAARNSYSNENKIYGEIQTYTETSAKTPDIYKHVGKTSEEETKAYYIAPTTLTYTEESSLEVQQTYYSFENTSANYFDDAIFYELVFGTGTNYSLASRFACCESDTARFGLRSIGNAATLTGYNLFRSKGNFSSGRYHVRPVVTLGANIKISEAGGTADNARTLSK